MFRSVILLSIAVATLLSPTIASGGPYTLLHVFVGNPYASSGLTLGIDGSAYGTTGFGGGPNNAGTIYQISPTSGYHLIYAFNGSDGRTPGGTLVSDSAGNLYGVTVSGGAFAQCANNMGCGTVFQLSPPKDGGAWTETVLYNFTGGDDGAVPAAGVIFDSQGNLYGATVEGGASQCGVVYELSPGGNGQWVEQVLHNFTNECEPEGGLVFDDAGNLYGTTFAGGTFGAGAAFQLVSSPGNTWIYSPIFEFDPDIKDGSGPVGAMAFDSHENLYGATNAGGTLGAGTIFELTLDSGAWKQNVIHDFGSGNDGVSPVGDLVLDNSGNIFGATTFGGGGKGYGSIFRLEPGQDGIWTETVLGMGNGPRGESPRGALLLDGRGHIYGTTLDGGRTKNGQIGHGVVFRLNIGNPGQQNSLAD